MPSLGSVIYWRTAGVFDLYKNDTARLVGHRASKKQNLLRISNALSAIAAAEEGAPGTAAPRVPPHSVEAEQGVLGGLMLDNATLDSLQYLLSPEDFFLQEHRSIFNAILELAERQKPFDAVTLQEALNLSGKSELMGFTQGYVSELAKNTPSTANIETYARVVRERSQLRKIISTCISITDQAQSPAGMSAQDLIEDAERKILTLSSTRPKAGGPIGISKLLAKATEKIDARSKSGDLVTGLSTGFDDLDRKLDGLRPADLIIVAGRPSMGKTTFAMNMVENAVLHSEKAVMVYSLEMPGESLIMRMLSSLGSIDHSNIRSGRLLNEDWPKLTDAVRRLTDRKLFIDDTAGISPSEMRSRTRRIVRQHGPLALIMVDYLQLMQIPGASGKNRTNEISEISRSLKAMAKEFNCPVVALSQLNRTVEQRPNKRPLNSDLRESGAIEQDADVILFVYRDEIYYPDSRFKGTAEIIIGKHREGETGFSRLTFVDRFTRFENLEPGAHEFTDSELGNVPKPKDPRVGRSIASELVHIEKFRKYDPQTKNYARGPTRPRKKT